MRKLQARLEVADPDMTPMLDIVFILLIFFVVTSSFTRESSLPLPIPNSRGEPQVKPETPLHLLVVGADASIQLDGLSLDARAVQSRLSGLVAQDPALRVRVLVDPQAPLEALTQSVNSARAAGVEKLAVLPLQATATR